MDIFLRKIDAGAIKVIDEKAKNNNMTRNELLKNRIEELATFDGIKQTEKEMDSTLNKVGDALEMTFNRLNQLEKRTEKMFFLLCDVSGLDPMEVNQMLDNMIKSKEKEG